MIPVKRVRGVAVFRSVRFDHHKIRSRLVEVRSVRFDHSKARRRLVELWRVRLTTAMRVGGL